MARLEPGTGSHSCMNFHKQREQTSRMNKHRIRDKQRKGAIVERGGGKARDPLAPAQGRVRHPVHPSSAAGGHSEKYGRGD